MNKDERTVYVFALRYALPRHTYALSIVSQMILSRLDAFEDWELDGMIRDCWIYYPALDCGGDIEGVYQSILFCDVRSVDAMIKELQMIKQLMIKDKLPEQDKEAVQDLMAFKERYTNGESTKG